MRWRWSNVPIPEAHLVGLIAGIILHLFVPVKLFQRPWAGHAIGWPVVGAGVFVAAWAVKSIQGMDIATPTRLISTGPYAFSRNPMYVAWTLIDLGIALAASAIWVIALLPAVIAGSHFFDILREERSLEQKFGDEYREYQARVRRYL